METDLQKGKIMNDIKLPENHNHGGIESYRVDPDKTVKRFGEMRLRAK